MSFRQVWPFHAGWLIATWLCLECVGGEWQIFTQETCAFDWDAYMEQVHRLRHGETSESDTQYRWNFNYTALRGDTGPLVYPAVHTWIHAGLSVASAWDPIHWTTEYTPKNISGYASRTVRPHGLLFAIQQWYLLMHVLTLAVVIAVFLKAGAVRLRSSNLSDLASVALTCLLLSASRRVRNTSTLGLFNDTYATLGAQVAILLFCSRRWVWGCVIYSAAVAVKMNVLLYAPGLLFLLLTEGGVAFAARHIAVCAAVQLAAAAPFLATAPIAYISAAFDLGRHFTHEWSVNLRFLPVEVFQHRAVAVGLLLVHVALLFVMWLRLWQPLAAPATTATRVSEQHDVHAVVVHALERGQSDTDVREPGLDAEKLLRSRRRSSHPATPAYPPSEGAHDGINTVGLGVGISRMNSLSPRSIAFVLYSSNFVGVVCARSLHFQFFVWYFHSLPLLLLHARVPWPLHMAVVIALELCWGNHPPQPWSSACITALHLLLLAALFFRAGGTPVPRRLFGGHTHWLLWAPQ